MPPKKKKGGGSVRRSSNKVDAERPPLSTRNKKSNIESTNKKERDEMGISCSRKKKKVKKEIPVVTPATTVHWEQGAVGAVEMWMRHYGNLTQEKIGEEFKNDVANYFAPSYTYNEFNRHLEMNRYHDVVCLDSTRVPLPEPQTYIHANWVADPKLGERRFILTQAPMENTIGDFWRMCYEHKVAAIVLLCGLKENDQILCTEFWPLKENDYKTFGGMFVKTMKMEETSDEQIFNIEVVPDGNSNSQIVKLYHYDKWEEKSTQKNARQILRLNKMLDSNSAIVAVDSAGIGRAAVLAAFDYTMGCLQQSKGEQVVMPEVVRWLRRQRASCFTNEEQYLFCIRICAEYLHRSFGGKFDKEYKNICP